MGATKNFKTVAKIQHAWGDEDLKAAIGLNPENDYLLDDTLTGPDRPLQLLFTDETLFEHGRSSSEHYYIQNEDDLIVAAVTIDNHSDSIFFEQISTHPDYRQKGYARALIETVMRQALNEGKILRMQGPTEMGAAYVLPLIAKIHKDMPGLEIIYFNAECPAPLEMPARNHPEPGSIAA